MAKLIEKKLSYKIQGIFIEISNEYGHLFKEKFYQNILKEKLASNKINYTQEPRINIRSFQTGKIMCLYNPDFEIEGKIIIELKTQKFLAKNQVNQLEQYLKASNFELGYLVNFGKPKVQIIRRIYTNNNKPWLKVPLASHS